MLSLKTKRAAGPFGPSTRLAFPHASYRVASLLRNPVTTPYKTAVGSLRTVHSPCLPRTIGAPIKPGRTNSLIA